MLKLLWKRIRLYRIYKKYAFELKYANNVKIKLFYEERIKELEKEIKELELIYFYNQSLFLYCPNCEEELISQHNEYEEKGMVVIYKCTKCNHVSSWVNGVAPIPILLHNEKEREEYEELVVIEEDK